MAGGSRQQALEAAGHLASAAMRKKDVSVCAQLALIQYGNKGGERKWG